MNKISLTSWRWIPGPWKAAYLNSGGIFDIPLLTQKIEELEAKAANPEFWNRQEQAREVLAETKLNKDKLEPFLAQVKAVDDLVKSFSDLHID